MTKIYQEKLKTDSSKKEDIRITRTKRDLSNALEKLLAEKNYDNITVKEICECAMVSKLTFYNNFLNKNSLLIYIFKRDTAATFKNLKEMLRTDTDKDKLFKIHLQLVINKFYEPNSKILNMIRNDESKSLYWSLYQFIKEIIPFFVETYQRNLIDKIPLEIISSYYSGAITGLIYSMASENFTAPVDKMVDYIYQLTTTHNSLIVEPFKNN